jgi:hypothetical protein
MNRQQVILESSPAFILVCLILAVGLAYLLYRTNINPPWSKTWNRILFGLRALLSFVLMFLLLGPIVKQFSNLFEKPLVVILYDNSSSIKETTDSATLKQLTRNLTETADSWREKGYEVRINDLSSEISEPKFTGNMSDLNNALKKITARYEGKKIDAVVLVSDGIYNAGISPLYALHNYPVYTIGLGDTLQRKDIGIKNLAYNKIAYEGNKFPLRVELAVRNIEQQPIRVTLLQRGKVLEQQTKSPEGDQLLTFDFQPLANEQGIQKVDIQVEVKPGERNVRNNRASIFVDVVAGKKKILVVAPGPHPDIKAIKEVVDKNSNYEFLLHIPGLEEQQPANLQPEDIDLAIFHQSPDNKGRTRDLFQKFINSKTSLFIVLGQQTDLIQLVRQNTPIRFDVPPREFDEVTPVINPAFSNFTLSTTTNGLITDYPPVSVHFGKIRIQPTATPLLFQRVGSLGTEKPLLAVDIQNNRKIGVLLGEGIWRWRLNEYDRTERTDAFDEVFGKLFQFLSTSEDKRKFRSYPIQQEFSDTESVSFESQVYNDIFEPIYGNTIKLELTNETGQKTSYSYVTSPGNIRYEVGGLKEGVYRYKASTTLKEKTEEVKGEFAVVAPQTELQNLTADFDLLRQLSNNSGGKFYAAADVESLKQDLLAHEVRSTIHTEESYSSLLNLKWVFWLLLLFVSGEWFIRKYFGSY